MAISFTEKAKEILLTGEVKPFSDGKMAFDAITIRKAKSKSGMLEVVFSLKGFGDLMFMEAMCHLDFNKGDTLNITDINGTVDYKIVG